MVIDWLVGAAAAAIIYGVSLWVRRVSGRGEATSQVGRVAAAADLLVGMHRASDVSDELWDFVVIQPRFLRFSKVVDGASDVPWSEVESALAGYGARLIAGPRATRLWERHFAQW